MKIFSVYCVLIAGLFFAACGNANGDQPDAGVNKTDTVARSSPSADDTVGPSPYTRDTLKNHLDSTKGSDSLRR